MEDKKDIFKQILRKHFKHTPTEDQENCIGRLSHFIYDYAHHPLFLLRGYAGTGKTTLISAFINTCISYKAKPVLLAPTGRAAKVISNYSHQPASTIHKRIYFRTTDTNGNSNFTLQQNLFRNALFIVDEASMISDSNTDGMSLLHDLIQHVYSGVNCRLVLIGDPGQLPPVGCNESPALDPEYLKTSFDISLYQAELKEVMRQSADSGILYNATSLRIQMLQNPDVYPTFELEGFSDIVSIPGNELQDYLETSYRNFGIEGTCVITRSNKLANAYNQQIRNVVRWQESLISSGDYVMVVKNNYYWLDESSSAGFIANGDMAEILRVSTIKEVYGFNFANVTLRLCDYPEIQPFEAWILLDTLTSESPALTEKQQRDLFYTIMEDYADMNSKANRIAAVKNNPFYNALQVKFAYTITCHKSQGGQWNHVYIEQGYLTEEMVNLEYFRWLYTAITRGVDKVYLINFKEEFFN